MFTITTNSKEGEESRLGRRNGRRRRQGRAAFDDRSGTIDKPCGMKQLGRHVIKEGAKYAPDSVEALDLAPLADEAAPCLFRL
jgi:hypothetical protein